MIASFDRHIAVVLILVPVTVDPSRDPIDVRPAPDRSPRTGGGGSGRGGFGGGRFGLYSWGAVGDTMSAAAAGIDLSD